MGKCHNKDYFAGARDKSINKLALQDKKLGTIAAGNLMKLK